MAYSAHVSATEMRVIMDDTHVTAGEAGRDAPAEPPEPTRFPSSFKVKWGDNNEWHDLAGAIVSWSVLGFLIWLVVALPKHVWQGGLWVPLILGMALALAFGAFRTIDLYFWQQTQAEKQRDSIRGRMYVFGEASQYNNDLADRAIESGAKQSSRPGANRTPLVQFPQAWVKRSGTRLTWLVNAGNEVCTVAQGATHRAHEAAKRTDEPADAPPE